MTKFALIDVSNLVHRAKHSTTGGRSSTPYDPFGDESTPEDPMKARIGLILRVVMSGILNAAQQFEASHCIAAFDTKSWRRAVYPDYKATRRDVVRTPEEEAEYEMIKSVMDIVKEFLRDYTNVTVLGADGIEADDFIARWVQLHDDPVFEHVIISADGDFKQLVRDGVDLFNPIVDSRTLYTMDGVFIQDGKKAKKTDETVQKYGQKWKVKTDKKTGEPLSFDPEWELFEKCIRGDNSDNIKSAYPRVYLTKMKKAFYGPVDEYNNFINSTYGSKDAPTSVKDNFDFNKSLIDLTAQPDWVVARMDETIEAALSKKPAPLIGAYFAKFCGKYKLTTLTPRAQSFVNILAKSYPS